MVESRDRALALRKRSQAPLLPHHSPRRLPNADDPGLSDSEQLEAHVRELTIIGRQVYRTIRNCHPALARQLDTALDNVELWFEDGNEELRRAALNRGLP